MANSYTPEEIEELKAREADEIKRLGKATVETRMALIDLAAGTKGLTETMTKGLGSLGTSAMDLSRQLYNGNSGLSVFNNSIGAVSDALGDLAGLIPYVGPLFKGLIKGAGDYAKTVNLHADQLYKSYQEMSQIGATTAGGVSDLYDNLKRMNYSSTTEMGVFTGLVRENSQVLASFGKTVGSGLTEIAGVSQAIQDGEVGRHLLLMGTSVDDINRGIISFTKMQMLTGGRQKMTTEELISASQNYIKEVDLLAKITGKDRASQEKSQESAMGRERYAAHTFELKQRAKQGGELGKMYEDQITTNNRVQESMEKDMPGYRKGFLDILSKTIGSPEAKELTLAMPRAAAVAQKKFFTVAEFEAAQLEDLKYNLLGVGDQIIGSAVAIGSIGGYGPGGFGSLQEQMARYGTLMQGTFEERKAQADKDKTITDRTTQSIVDTNIQNRKTIATLQDLVHYGIVPVTSATNAAAGAVNNLVTAFEDAAKKLGVVVKPRNAPSVPTFTPPAAAPPPAAAQPRPAAAPPAAAPPRPAAAPPPAGPVPAPVGPVVPARPPRSGTPVIVPPAASPAAAPGSDILSSLNIKSPESVAGGPADPRLLELAKKIQDMYPTARFTALNDRFHQVNYPNSKHTKGQALDFTTNPAPMDASQAMDIKRIVQSLGFASVKDEYFSDKNRYTTGGHFHAELANGGVIPAVKGGVNVLAAEAGKNEAFVPLPDGKTIPVTIAGNEEQMGMMAAQLDRLDDMIQLMQTQVSVSLKILRYAQ